MPNGFCGVWNCFEKGDYVIDHEINDDITVFPDVCLKHYKEIIYFKNNIRD